VIYKYVYVGFIYCVAVGDAFIMKKALLGSH